MVLLCVSAPVTAFSNHDLTHRLITLGCFLCTVNKPTPWSPCNEVTKPGDAIYLQNSTRTLKCFRNYFNLFKQSAGSCTERCVGIFLKTVPPLLVIRCSFNGQNVSRLLDWINVLRCALGYLFWNDNANKKVFYWQRHLFCCPLVRELESQIDRFIYRSGRSIVFRDN